MEKEQKIKKRIGVLKKLISQLYEEIEANEEIEVMADFESIAGALEENLSELEKELNFVFQTEMPSSASNSAEVGLKRIKVDSSMINAVGYDAREEILYLEFVNSGKIYAYYEVESEIFEELLESDSIGSYVRNNILDCYGCSQINRRNFKW